MIFSLQKLHAELKGRLKKLAQEYNKSEAGQAEQARWKRRNQGSLDVMDFENCLTWTGGVHEFELDLFRHRLSGVFAENT